VIERERERDHIVTQPGIAAVVYSSKPLKQRVGANMSNLHYSNSKNNSNVLNNGHRAGAGDLLEFDPIELQAAASPVPSVE